MNTRTPESQHHQLDRSGKLLLLQILQRGYYTADDLDQLQPPSKDYSTIEKAELVKEYDHILKACEQVLISEDKAKELAKLGVLEYDGSTNLLAEV